MHLRDTLIPVRLLACILVPVAVVATGCGGGGRLTAQEFRHEASEICREGNSRVRRVHVPRLENVAGASRGIARVVEKQRESLSALRDLEGPKKDAMVIEKWLVVVDQLLDEADTVREALHANEALQARDIAARALVLDERARVLAEEYGVEPCRVRATALGIS